MSKSAWTKYNLNCIKTICGKCNGPWMPILNKQGYLPYYEQIDKTIKLSQELTSIPTRLNGQIDQRLIATCPHCGDKTYEWYRASIETRMIQRSRL